MSRELPIGWEVTPLGDLCSKIQNGVSCQQTKDGQGVPVTRIETIAGGNIDYNRIGFAEEEGVKWDSFQLQPNDILFSHINSVKHIGKIALYHGERPLFHGMNLLNIRADKNKVSAKFIHYFLNQDKTRRYFQRICKKAINQASVNTSDVRTLSCHLPPLPEQKEIAAILSSVDEAINATQAVIDQTRKVKEGLLQDLLTRGIGHTRFKQTEIGDIPEGWELATGDKLFSLKGGVGPSSIIMNIDGDCLFVKVDDFNNPNNAYGICESNLVFNVDSQSKVPKLFNDGTIIFPKRGAAIFKNRVQMLRGKGTVDPNLMCLTCYKKISPEFMCYYLKHLGLHKIADTSSVPQINNKHLYPILFAVPSLKEQLRIVEKLEAIDNATKAEEAKLTQLQQTKRGLMQDLLSGDVRVAV